ncbi:MAG TPA: G5 domain-containing protein [Candidatus Moranbacteria bacterium]|nr:G5 domain-containing protein [Candidatus Moranbacteria bacterium]
MNPEKTFKLAIFIIILVSVPVLMGFFRSSRQSVNFENSSKLIKIDDNGLNYSLITDATALDNFLKENKINLGDHDEIIPSKNSFLYPGMNIIIKRAARVKIEVDGKKIEGYTLGKTVSEALFDNEVTLTRLDKTDPDKNFPVADNSKIIVTRINEEEVTQEEPIDFKTTVKNDSKMGWREKKVETPGEKGIKEVSYKITYKNGKEISRILLDKKVTKEPVTQVETQGTYVKLGKTHKGQGTWYAFKGGLFAASPWLPIGSYAKVTNTGNGKSVIVQINDRGPFGPGRIIDLDKVAFQKIASIGAGVIGVKVEEVLN